MRIAAIGKWKRPLAIAATAAAAAATFVAINVTASSQAAACNGYVGLTFDDGPRAGNTQNLLAALRNNGLRATMFNQGSYVASNPSLVRAQVDAGMWVANHSYTHPHMTQQSQATMDSEISRTQSAIANAGGGTPRLFRPPYGETNATLRAVEQKYGLTEIIWDVDSQDWNNASVDAIVSAAGRLQNGQIILMHDWPANTVAAIPRIAQNLASRNLCSGMISPSTGRAVAPDGGGNPQPTSTTTPPPGGGNCTATLSAGQQFGDRFNLNVAVSGSSNWTVTLNLNGSQSIQNSWNASVSGTTGRVTARPNGSGNNFGITIMANGNWTWPSTSCTAS
ncbi:polysaccharide deacetylase family protein [Actinoplanes sp. NPDC051861]|uniref:polysaccharide deacetylase family protein n=1 Tax=Actinoplanes sp. NPDC051861 TaxID=3155170 RepID=UPI003422B654